MWETLKILFQSKNDSRKMVLREKLRDTKMTRSNMVTTYLTRIQQVRDEMNKIGETVDDSKLVRMALKGFPKEWTYPSKILWHMRSSMSGQGCGMTSFKKNFDMKI
jgi:hypothetical protein